MTGFEEQAKRYLILIEGGPPSNYSAWSPDLPGCAATGDTLEEVEREMRAAITLHLEGLAEDRDSVPEPSGPGVYVERAGLADGDELRRVAVEPRAEVADGVDLEVLEVGIRSRLRGHLRDEEQVVEVAVEMEAGREHGVHGRPGVRQRHRNVEEELRRTRVGDDRSLVADDEIVEARQLEIRPHRPEHAAGDDHDVDARGAGAYESLAGARPQHAVLGDEGAVEIEREGGHAPREALWERERYGTVPPVDFTT